MCNDELSLPVENYDYGITTVSSYFDPDFYHDKKEARIKVENSFVQLSTESTKRQTVKATQK